MNNLTYRDNLFQNLFDFRRDFDQMFNRFLVTWPGNQEIKSEFGSMAAFVPPVDAYIDKDGKKFYGHVALPGVDPKDMTIQVQRNLPSIRGERKLTHETRNADLVHSEFVQGTFERNLALPEGVDGEKLTAEYRNGVLEITAPISASAMPRRIEIKSVPTAKQFAASSGS
jgi:HSP20 family protein